MSYLRDKSLFTGVVCQDIFNEISKFINCRKCLDNRILYHQDKDLLDKAYSYLMKNNDMIDQVFFLRNKEVWKENNLTVDYNIFNVLKNVPLFEFVLGDGNGSCYRVRTPEEYCTCTDDPPIYPCPHWDDPFRDQDNVKLYNKCILKEIGLPKIAEMTTQIINLLTTEQIINSMKRILNSSYYNIFCDSTKKDIIIGFMVYIYYFKNKGNILPYIDKVNVNTNKQNIEMNDLLVMLMAFYNGCENCKNNENYREILIHHYVLLTKTIKNVDSYMHSIKPKPVKKPITWYFDNVEKEENDLDESDWPKL